MAAPKQPCVPETTRSQFIEERRFLKNVTPATLSWYGSAFQAFVGCDTAAQYNQRIIELLKREVKPVSINSWIRCINAYEHWRGGANGASLCSPACTHTKLPKLKLPNTILQTLSMEQVQVLLTARPAALDAQRVQVLAALLMDTGLRIQEALSLRRRDVDLEGLLLKTMGKGRKERQVPISQAGRKWLYGWLRRSPTATPDAYVFACRTGSALSIRNAQRDLGMFCRSCGTTGVRCSPHTFRHTFAVSYLRAGGNLEYLRRILGHTSIIVTQRYLRSLKPDDLQAVHNSFSPLAKL